MFNVKVYNNMIPKKDHKESYGSLPKGCMRLTNPLVNA